jgi:hypothetical protein
LYASIDKFSEIVEKLKARDSAFFYKIDRQLLPKNLTNRTAAKHIYRIELSFINTDLDQVVSPDLVSFVELVFDEKDTHPWPLFASDLSFPKYAWSIAGEAEYQRRRKGNQMRRERRPISTSAG